MCLRPESTLASHANENEFACTAGLIFFLPKTRFFFFFPLFMCVLVTQEDKDASFTSYIFVLLFLFRARKDSEVTLDANKYMSLVRVLSKHGKVEG